MTPIQKKKNKHKKHNKKINSVDNILPGILLLNEYHEDLHRNTHASVAI